MNSHLDLHLKLVRHFLPGPLTQTVIFIFGVLAFPLTALAQHDTANIGLTVNIPGISDQADFNSIANAAAFGPSSHRFVIVFDDGSISAEDIGRNLRRAPVFLDMNLFTESPATRGRRRFGQYLMRLHPLVDSRNVILVNPNDPATTRGLEFRLEEIARLPNANVIIDMDLGLELKHIGLHHGRPTFADNWGPQTRLAGQVATRLAERFISHHPTPQGSLPATQLICHSAGCEAALVIHGTELATGRRLYPHPIAMSARTPEAHPPDTVMFVSRNDFPNSPTGVPSPKWADAERLHRQGFAVVKIENPGWGLWHVGHTATQQVWTPDRAISVYPRGSREGPVVFPNTSLLGTVPTALGIDRSGQQQDAGTAFRRMQEAAKRLRAAEPTQGLGGISLNAVARVQIDTKEVMEAGYQEGRLYIRLRSGKKILLPNMDREVVLLSFQVAYRDNTKPELSIGSPPEAAQERPEKPGWLPIYYLGNTENTSLGLAMERADKLLGALTYGATEVVRPIREKVPNFRSAAELFPEKYTDHQDAHRYVGVDERVYLQSSHVQLKVAEKGDELQFAQTSFNLRFGKSGPAEEAYAAFFTAHFDEIADTAMGAPFKALVPYAQVVAWFRWLRSHEVPFAPGELGNARPAIVFTPTKTAYIPLPKFSEIVSSGPTIRFGPNGPERIIWPESRETVLTYENAKPIKVCRYDGKVLEVIRGSVPVPVGLRMTGGYEAAFFVHEKLGPVFAENVRLIREGGNLAVQTQDDSVIYPHDDPDALIVLLMSRFAFAEPAKAAQGSLSTYIVWGIALASVVLLVCVIGIAKKWRKAAKAT